MNAIRSISLPVKVWRGDFRAFGDITVVDIMIQATCSG